MGDMSPAPFGADATMRGTKINRYLHNGRFFSGLWPKTSLAFGSEHTLGDREFCFAVKVMWKEVLPTGTGKPLPMPPPKSGVSQMPSVPVALTHQHAAH